MDRDLLPVARNSLKRHLKLDNERIEPKPEWLLPAATFVTLTMEGKLRGCIGSLQARRSLFEDVENNAVSAGFRDPRFLPIIPEDLKALKIEISVLSPLREIEFSNQTDILDAIIPFKMGLVLKFEHFRGTFLPQVWEYYPEPKDFFRNLKIKAGLYPDFFDPEMKLFYYEVEKCQE